MAPWKGQTPQAARKGHSPFAFLKKRAVDELTRIPGEPQHE